jgi:ABC-type sugar transport system substrate-binding protein
VADQLLKIIDAAGVKTFLAYSSIPVDQRGGVGSPRGKYKGWLGSLEPRAEDAGDLTADALIERGKRQKAFGPDGKLHLLAIAGDRSTPSSIKRNQGMRRAVADDPNVLRVVDAGKSRRASRMALSALSACQAHMGG